MAQYTNRAFIWLDNVAVPDNPKVAVCRLCLTAKEDRMLESVRVKIYFVSTADPAAPTTIEELYAYDLTKSVLWWDIPVIAAGQQYFSPNLKSIAQEAFDVDGRTENDAVCLIIEEYSSTAVRGFSSVFYDSGSAAPQLDFAFWSDKEQVAMPTFVPNGGKYETDEFGDVDPVTVTISCSESGASIRYTTDGTEPTESSTLYSAPISITPPKTLKARAFKSGKLASNRNSKTFALLSQGEWGVSSCVTVSGTGSCDVVVIGEDDGPYEWKAEVPTGEVYVSPITSNGSNTLITNGAEGAIKITAKNNSQIVQGWVRGPGKWGATTVVCWQNEGTFWWGNLLGFVYTFMPNACCKRDIRGAKDPGWNPPPFDTSCVKFVTEAYEQTGGINPNEYDYNYYTESGKLIELYVTEQRWRPGDWVEDPDTGAYGQGWGWGFTSTSTTTTTTTAPPVFE